MSRRGSLPANEHELAARDHRFACFSASAGAGFSGSKRSRADAYAGTAGPNLKTVSQ